jgi:hypothetical protein
MVVRRRVQGLFALLLIVLLGLSIGPPASYAAPPADTDPDFISEPTAADIWCWCTQFVYNKKHLSGSYGDAHTWNDGYLQSQGYHEVWPPAKGDIAVYETNLMPPHGHVAIFKGEQDGAWIMLGANQETSEANWISKAGCKNVTKTRFRIRGQYEGVSFWRK